MPALYERLAGLSLEIGSYDLDRHEMDTSAGFTRVTTVVELFGPRAAETETTGSSEAATTGDAEAEVTGGDGAGTTGDDGAGAASDDSAGTTRDGANAAGPDEDDAIGRDAIETVGRGEDVTYDTGDHDALREAHESGALGWDLTGTYTVDSFSDYVAELDLFPEPPERETARHYRRWALESAGLDLALRQADTDLATALGREYDPVRFVVSTRLDTEGEPAADRIHGWLDVDSTLEFKLDPTSEWNRSFIDDLAATDSVRVLDFKNYYEGTDVDAAPDPDLYRRVAPAFPDAVLEDVKYTDETRETLAGNEDRLSWDFPVTDVESVRELPVEPEWLNIKPSRFGTIEALFDAIDHCLDEGISMYGGGQYELGVGREHLHAVASACYPDGPNDVAPRAYNRPEPHADVPPSPLSPPTDPVGLRWRSD